MAAKVMTLADLQARADYRSGYQKLWQSVLDFTKEEIKDDPAKMLRADPCLIFAPVTSQVDDWQRQVMNSTALKTMLLCSRQSGKSFLMSALALTEAIKYPNSEILIVSRTMRQGLELMRKVKELWRGITGGKVNRRGRWSPKTLYPDAVLADCNIKAKGWDGAALIGEEYENQTKSLKQSHEMPNGSRITCLPGNPDNIVAFSAVTLLIIDEASRVPDQVMSVTGPFLAATESVHGRPGRTIVASTPFGKRGWFWEAYDRTEKLRLAWERGVADKLRGAEACPYSEADPTRRLERDSWKRGHEGREADLPWDVVKVTADQCPRITRQFLDDELAQIGKRWYDQEYGCQFVDVTDAVFAHEVIQEMLTESYSPFKLWCET